MTLERIRVCKRDGRLLEEPRDVPAADPSGLGVWQKLMVYAGEQSRHAGRPLYQELVRALREAGAAGATSLRGSWGYHGDHAPHGDKLLQARRRVPVVTVIVDTPERTRRWFEIVDRVTDETGLVTSEMVPAFRATGPDRLERGGLRLADLS
jgi:PII-like signaling protein